MESTNNNIPPGKLDQTINGIRFTSNFDSGNLQKVEQQSENFFQLYLSKDPGSTLNCWFYFKLKSQKQVALNLQIFDLNYPLFFKQYQKGKGIYLKRQKSKLWQEIPLKDFKINKQNQTFSIEFELELEENLEYSVAFTYPWSFQHNQRWVSDIEKQFIKNQTYFQREILTYSKENNPIELLTITSQKNILENSFESLIPNLFPSQQNQNQNQQNIEKQQQYRQCHKFQNKKYILISTRVHAGETPANYTLRGIVNFLLEKSIDAETFLDEFVVCMIPMLNPDGVIKGNYRYDTCGNDLNRCYNKCLKNQNLYPSNYALLNLAKYLDQDSQKLYAYFDLHAHVNYSGSFMFSNTHTDPYLKSQQKLIPKLMSHYVPSFSFPNSGFNIFNSQTTNNIEPQLDQFHPQKQNLIHSQKQQQQSQEEKEQQKIVNFQGVAKTDVYLSTSINLSYTVECNYSSYPNNPNNNKEKTPKMKISDYENVGKGICLSLLELIEKKQTSIFSQEEKLKQHKNIHTYLDELIKNNI